MIDASSKPFEENIALTRQVVEYAHDHGVVVEAELGTLAGVEDEVSVDSDKAMYTHPEEVVEFATRTGCDSLAIAIGTSHGAYKFKPGTKPQLRFDVLEECSKQLPGFPIVLHGSSSVPQEFVKIINEYGGNMPGAIGVPEEQLRQAARSAVCKINIDSDIRLAMTAVIRKYFAEHPITSIPGSTSSRPVRLCTTWLLTKSLTFSAATEKPDPVKRKTALKHSALFFCVFARSKGCVFRNRKQDSGHKFFQALECICR